MIDILLKINRLISSGSRAKTDVAKELGVARNTLDSWGKNIYPRVDQLMKLSLIYTVPLSYFFEELKGSEQNIGHKIGGVNGNGNNIQNGHINVTQSNAEKEIEHLKSLLIEKEQMIKEKDERLKDKDQLIVLLSSNR